MVFQSRYRLRAGESTRVDAPLETLDFVRNAKRRTVAIEGRQTSGFAVGPNMRGDEILLAASLTMKAGEYTVTVSAVGESGEERAAAASITVDALPVVPSGGSTPPVVLLNGWQFSVFPPSSCPISATGSAETFGSLTTQLVAPEVYFFDNCVEQSVNGSSIEELGVTLGQFLNMVQYADGALVPQVDLIGHSMGGLIVRSYLAGLQANDALSPVLNPRVRKFIEIATPNFGSFLAANYSDAFASGTQAAEMVPGSGLLWTLGTWNQRGDDLRGVDALAIIGNAGYWKSSIFSLTQLNNATDGVVSMTSASLNFARDPSRTRILPYCHIDSVAGAVIDCTGKGIADVDEAPETGVIVLSFLANTTAWESEGYSNQTQYGGGYFALENAAGTQYTAFSSVLLGSQSFETGAGTTNTIFYNEFVNIGTATFTATSTANQVTTCGPFTVTGGYYSIFRCKFSPVISSVGPLLPSVAGRVVTSGGSITIGGVGFGQQCSGCQVLAYPGPVALQVSSWSDAAIAALLPSTFNGIAEIVVQAAAGSDSITFMASPPPVPPTISLSNTQLQFTYTMGGASPAAQTVTVANSGGGTLTWSATTSASWLSAASPSGTAPSTLSVLVSPTGLGAGTYTGSVQISAAGASNSPVSVTVTLTVAPAAAVLAVSPKALTFNYTAGGTVPGAQGISITNTGGGTLSWIASASATWVGLSSASGTAPAMLSVSVNPATLAAGQYSGTIQIAAAGVSNSPQTISVSLAIAAPSTLPTITSVVNGASFQPGIESGSWVTIQGANLANTNPGRTWRPDEIVNGDLPTSLDGVSATIDGKTAFVYYISPTQLNVQAPTDVTTGAVPVVVTNNGQMSATFTAQLQTYGPAFFLYTGTSYAIASHFPDYGLVANPSLIPGTVAAKPGDVLILWATGFGPTNPPTPAGIAVSGAPATATAPTVTVGGVPVTTISSVLSPGSAGLYQVAIQLPAAVPTGAVAIQASVGGVQSPGGVVIFVSAQ